MTSGIKTVVLYLVRILVLWVVDALSLLATAWLLPGMTISAVGDTPAALVAVGVRPSCLPSSTCSSVPSSSDRPGPWAGLPCLSSASWSTRWPWGSRPGCCPVSTWTSWAAIVGGIVFGFFNAIFTGILEVDEEGSLYQNRIEHRAKEKAV